MSQVRSSDLIVFGEVGTKDPIFHLLGGCEAIPQQGALMMRWSEAKERVMLPRFCEVCGPLAVAR